MVLAAECYYVQGVEGLARAFARLPSFYLKYLDYDLSRSRLPWMPLLASIS